MLGVNPVIVYGLLVTTVPTVVGSGPAPTQGTAYTCQEVEVPGSVQLNVTEVWVSPEVVNDNGLGHVGAVTQETFANHPVDDTELSDVNTNVKHPQAEEPINSGGKVVPV